MRLIYGEAPTYVNFVKMLSGTSVLFSFFILIIVFQCFGTRQLRLIVEMNEIVPCLIYVNSCVRDDMLHITDTIIFVFIALKCKFKS